MESHETEFIFVGENLAIDLINTEIIARRKQYDLLETPDHLAVWWESAQAQHPEMAVVEGSHSIVFDMILLETVKELRGNLRSLFGYVIENETPGADETQFLNSILAKGSPALTWDGQTPQHSYWCGSDAYAELLLPIALSALHLLAHEDLDRLHHCHNNNCILMFYDTTKSGTRRWCSTACMDRERSARRYREQKQKKRT